MRLTHPGHACLLVETHSPRLLPDPGAAPGERLRIGGPTVEVADADM